MSSPALPLPVSYASDHLHWAGDSLVANGEVDPIRIFAHANQRNAWSSSPITLSVGASAGSGSPPRMPITSDGIAGTTIAQLDSNKATRVLAYNPTILVVVVSPNDLGLPANSWSTSMDSIRTAMLNQNPSCKIAVRAMLFAPGVGEGETWVDNGDGTASWPSTTNNVKLATLNTEAQTWASNNGAYWIDIRSGNGTEANRLLTYEKANNPSKAASGAPPLLTADGEHPQLGSITWTSSGIYKVGQMLLAQMSFS